MYCDNTEAITIANESGITKGARHFRAKFHYLREVIEYGDIKLENVHTGDNLADPFTKALAFPKHSEHTRNIGMLPASLPFELEWDPLPNYTIGSSNSFEWRKIIFKMITSMGIRHAKAYTLRGRSSTKLGQRDTPCASLNIVFPFVLTQVIQDLAIQQPSQELFNPFEA
ncbi:hypothetical protein Tco_0930901 [Tanacetum coccineum]